MDFGRRENKHSIVNEIVNNDGVFVDEVCDIGFVVDKRRIWATW